MAAVHGGRHGSGGRRVAWQRPTAGGIAAAGAGRYRSGGRWAVSQQRAAWQRRAGGRAWHCRTGRAWCPRPPTPSSLFWLSIDREDRSSWEPVARARAVGGCGMACELRVKRPGEPRRAGHRPSSRPQATRGLHRRWYKGAGVGAEARVGADAGGRSRRRGSEPTPGVGADARVGADAGGRSRRRGVGADARVGADAGGSEPTPGSEPTHESVIEVAARGPRSSSMSPWLVQVYAAPGRGRRLLIVNIGEINLMSELRVLHGKGEGSSADAADGRGPRAARAVEAAGRQAAGRGA
jgi:hypothetical protein